MAEKVGYSSTAEATTGGDWSAYTLLGLVGDYASCIGSNVGAALPYANGLENGLGFARAPNGFKTFFFIPPFACALPPPILKFGFEKRFALGLEYALAPTELSGLD